MSTNVNIDPERAFAVFNAWEHLAPGRIALRGHDLLDAAAFGLLKSEFLAAQAGVVPFIPLPGGGQGVLMVGGALDQPKTRWPQEPLRQLYMQQHRAMNTIHASVRAARPDTPVLNPPTTPHKPLIDQQYFESQTGKYQIGIPPAWIVIAAVGILATIAGTYYATRTEVKRIEIDADLAKDSYKTAQLTDLAQQQLAKTGKIDDNLITAIKASGSGSSATVLPMVAVGVGAATLAATGTIYAMQKNKRRR